MQVVSKSQLKSQLLEYLRTVEKGKKPLIITHMGKPVLKISPHKEDPNNTILALRNSVVSYDNPTSPVGETDWETVK